MHKHKRRSEGVLYKAPNTRSRLHIEVRDKLAGTEIHQMVLFYILLGLKAVEMFMVTQNYLYIRRNRLSVIKM